jgi:hypothetical protein
MLARRSVAILVLSTPVALFAQSAGSEQPFSIVAVGGQAATQPYTATFETKQIQTLTDGTTITNTRITKEGRDSEGRTFHQFTMGGPGQDTATFTVVVSAPEREVLQWTSQSDTVSVQHLGDPDETRPPQPPRHAPVKPPSSQVQVEPLGHKTIQGLDAVGFRETRTILEGAEGNDRPIAIVIETWKSYGPGPATSKLGWGCPCAFSPRAGRM